MTVPSTDCINVYFHLIAEKEMETQIDAAKPNEVQSSVA